jgi:hypothetical protein
MYFLYPAFLFAMVTLAIPVIVHLFNFRRYKKVLFSNVQFLREVQEQQSSRRNLKERLILLSRLLALFFLVLAFARPYVANNAAIVAGRQQAVSIFIDNSYSMQALTREGSLLDQAKQKARQIAAAYSVNDRFQLLTQDFEGRHQRLVSRDEFNDAVGQVQISAQSGGLKQIISRQQSLLNLQPGNTARSYIISDFQKNLNTGNVTDAGFPVSLVYLRSASLPNVAIDSVWLLSATHRPGEAERLVVKLHNYAGKTAEKIPLKLQINGAQKALASYTVKAGTAQTDTLNFSGLQAGWQRCEITLQDNPVVFDNSFYFSFKVDNKLPVLLVNGGAPNKYLNAVFASDAFFKVNNAQDGNVDYAGLSAYPLVVVSDVKAISTGLAQQLNVFVKRGGSLAFFPAAQAETATYDALLSPMGAAYPQRLIDQNVKTSTLNLQNDLLKGIFEDVPQNPDLPLVKKYYVFAGGNRGENLMRLQNNDALWQQFRYGKGKVYVGAVPLADEFSNLPLHALFVPIMYRMALLSGQPTPLFYTLGNNAPAEIPPIATGEKEILTVVKGNQKIIPDVKQQEGSTLLYLPGQLKQPGIYELRKQDSVAAILAFNNNRAESDLRYLTEAEAAGLFSKKADVFDGDKVNQTSMGSTANSAMQLWKLCIILALVCLAAETLLVRYFKTAKSTTKQPMV